MRPIDFARMNPRDRMLNALRGGGMGRAGVVTRLGAAGPVTSTTMAPALQVVDAPSLLPAVPMQTVDPVTLVMATPEGGGRVDTGPSSYSGTTTQLKDRRTSVSVSKPEVPSGGTVNNQNGLLDERADPNNETRFAPGKESWYDVESDQVPSQRPDVPAGMLPHAAARATTTAPVVPGTGKPIPWGKVAIGAAILGVGYFMWKK